ncbi:MAG: hypothetical protein GX364_05450 [Firmicutes bacterium]|jgi:hypothetical protein|nr:hypothetical protein [Bacillota bacterium]
MKRGRDEKVKADRLATSVQRLGVAGGFFRLVKTIGLSAVLFGLAIFFFYLGIPWYVGAALAVVAAGIIVFDVIVLRRTAAVDLNAPYEPDDGNVKPEPDEILVDSIPAVMQYGKTRSVAVLGTGKVLIPENALLITNKAIWALTVPLPGVDKVVADTDIGKWQWMMAYQDIINKLREMISTLQLQELLKQGRARRLMGWKEIKDVETLPLSQAISLTRTDGKRFGYSIRLKEDYQKAKEIFKIP